MKSEATFEAHLNGLLRSLFPLGNGIEVSHQVQFSVRVGHHDLHVDGPKGWIRKGRLDVLLSAAGGRHLAVLELKRSDLQLTDDDRNQGLSYARLLQPMPPLTIVSNGPETRFYTTVDGGGWTPKTLDDAAFAQLVSGATARAGKERDEAIRQVLGSEPDLWAQYLRAHTQAAIRDRTGTVEDFGLPFATGFSVPRAIVSSLQERIKAGAPVLVLVGAPLSGKSNAIRQCCAEMEDGNLVPFYVDAANARQGPLQLLASIFQRHLFSATSTDQVRQWLITSLRAEPSDSRVVLFLDDLVPELSDDRLSDLDELLSLPDSSRITIVLALDSNTWRALSSRPGRPTRTTLGRRAECLKLENLDDDEFSDAMETLFESTGSLPYRGGEFNAEYREPRLLRVVAASMRDTEQSDETVLRFPSTTTTQLVGQAWHAFARKNHETVNDLRRLARAFFEDLEAGDHGSAYLRLASYRAAAMRRETAERVLGSPVVDRLLQVGFVSTRIGPEDEVLLLPRHLELFAHAAALELSDAVCAAQSPDAAYDVLMRRSDMLPLGDIVGADALRACANREPELFQHAVNRALRDPPHDEVLPTGTRLEVSMFGRPVGYVDLDEPSTLTGNIHPWLVLAQVALLPLGGPEDRPTPRAWIIANVGSYAGFLRRVDDDRWQDVPGFHFHDVAGRGSVPCLNNGIVEPVGMAIVSGLHEQPAEMVSMARYAVEADEFRLAWRLGAAAREVASATQIEAAEAAKEVVRLTNEYLWRDFRDLLHVVEVEGGENGANAAPPRTSPSVGRQEKARLAQKRQKNQRSATSQRRSQGT